MDELLTRSEVVTASPRRRSTLVVKALSGGEILAQLADDWRALYRATQAAPFLSWEWAVTWQRWFGAGKTPYLLCVYDEYQLIGLLALVRESQRMVTLPLQMQRLSLLGGGFGGADYLDILAWPGREDEVATQILTYLVKAGDFDLLELDGLAIDSKTLARLAESETQGFRCRLLPRYCCPQIRLEGDWPTVLKSSRRASNFQRRLRQLSARAGFAHRAVTEPEEALSAFERFLQLHEGRWAGAGGSEMTGHERLISFHRDLVVRLAEAGLLRFDELWVEGQCRASIYGLEHGRQYFFYNSGFDQAWRGVSVGLVVLGLSIKSAVERGVAVYDFLRGTESYKFDWAGSTRETVMIRVAPSHLRATVLLAHAQAGDRLRRQLQTELPPWLLLPAQRVRRAWKRKYNLTEKKYTAE